MNFKEFFYNLEQTDFVDTFLALDCRGQKMLEGIPTGKAQIQQRQSKSKF